MAHPLALEALDALPTLAAMHAGLLAKKKLKAKGAEARDHVHGQVEAAMLEEMVDLEQLGKPGLR